MIYQIQDGDVIKLLPFINNEGKIIPFIEAQVVYVKNKQIFDTTGNLIKIRNKIHQMGLSGKYQIGTMYFFNCYFNSEIKVIKVGKSIRDIIINSESSPLNIRSNTHLIVRMKKVNSPIGPLNDYRESYIDNINWAPPVEDINSREEWIELIKSSKFDIFKYISDSSVSVHRKILIEYFGFDIMSDIISEEREKKIKEILV